MEIIPAILTKDIYEAGRLLNEVKKSGKFERVQIDFVDGEYNDNLTIKPEEVDITPFLGLEFDAHLMVVEKNIGEYKKQAVKAGFDRIIAQAESISRPEDFSGLALDVHSPVEAVEKYLTRLEVVIIMGVEPGFGGQEFNERVIEKVRRLSYLRNLGNLRFKVCVDGGVEREVLVELEKAGADEVAVGVGRVLSWM
jgi:ribulose-phosphate 3-epimerase